MPIKIGINGCGRIGKLLLRMLSDSAMFEVVVINDPISTEILFNLLKYDSLHGKFMKLESFTENTITIDGKPIAISHESNPAHIAWSKHSVDCVLEASGQFKTNRLLANHLQGSVQKVILCQPPEDTIDRTIVLGVNDETLTNTDSIISNASCTTNCIAPLLKVLNDAYGIEKAFFNTVHPYTNNQSLHDGPHTDPRRSRAALCNIIPTTSSAVKPLQLILPSLTGKIDGFATRVPVPLGAYVEICACITQQTTITELNALFKTVSQTTMRGIIEYSEDPLVSTDISGNTSSAIFDALSTKIIGNNFVQILAWYDNETGYSARVVDLLHQIWNNRT